MGIASRIVRVSLESYHVGTPTYAIPFLFSLTPRRHVPYTCPRALPPSTWKHPICMDREGIRGALGSIGTYSVLYYFSDLLHSSRHSNALRTREHMGRRVCVTADDAQATQVRRFSIYFSLSLSFSSPTPEQGLRNGHANATRHRMIALWATTSPCEPPPSILQVRLLITFSPFSYPFHSPRHANTSRTLKGPRRRRRCKIGAATSSFCYF